MSRTKLPRWLALANRLGIALQRMGLAVGTQHILTVAGRRTGRPRSTIVSVLALDGHRYIVAGGDATEWAKNARAARHGLLIRGRRSEHVALLEVPVDQRAPILREFLTQVRGVRPLVRSLGLPSDPDAFAAAAPRCPVFRLDRVPY